MATTGRELNYNYTAQPSQHIAPVKFYRVYDNGKCVLNTTCELDALRLFKKIIMKHDEGWAWVDEESLV